MAKKQMKTKKVEEPKVKVTEVEDMELKEALDSLEESLDLEDEPEDEETKVEESKATEQKPAIVVYTTKEVAAMVSKIVGHTVTPQKLRRKLRSNWYNDGEPTFYRWTPDDPVLKSILDSYRPKVEKQEKKVASN
jgi:hypothetical protein